MSQEQSSPDPQGARAGVTLRTSHTQKRTAIPPGMKTHDKSQHAGRKGCTHQSGYHNRQYKHPAPELAIKSTNSCSGWFLISRLVPKLLSTWSSSIQHRFHSTPWQTARAGLARHQNSHIITQAHGHEATSVGTGKSSSHARHCSKSKGCGTGAVHPHTDTDGGPTRTRGLKIDTSAGVRERRKSCLFTVVERFV